MLKIKNLKVSLEEEEKQIIKGLSLTVNPGEVHAIMGPNGSGKSTLSSVLAGKDGYVIDSGTVHFEDRDLLEVEVEERAALGIFMAFQYPTEIPGVGNMNFLRTALNSQRKTRGQDELNAADFLKLVRSIAKDLEITDEMMRRPVNVGASGGEKKRNEILQMCLLEPSFVILDETDSGLDVDAMKLVSRGVNNFSSASRSFLVITHYQRLLNYIVPDYVHIMVDGKIVETGTKNLALHVEETGYKDFLVTG
jgi:Fe-S cluster assembly ATP-binding protein